MIDVASTFKQAFLTVASLLQIRVYTLRAVPCGKLKTRVVFITMAQNGWPYERVRLAVDEFPKQSLLDAAKWLRNTKALANKLALHAPGNPIFLHKAGMCTAHTHVIFYCVLQICLQELTVSTHWSGE